MINYGSTPFAEQLTYFLGKDKLIPTQNWYDVQRELHDTGFMVAGAMKADLLADIKGALEKAHREGTTLAQFRKDIGATAEKLGWTAGWENADNVKNKSYLAWRTRVVYETNLRASYQAGRWQQIQETKKTRPYLIYKHSHAVLKAREEHIGYHNLVVPVDSAWVRTHYPPKGFGCKCTMFSLSEWEMNKLGKTVPDQPPADTFYNWTNPATGQVHKLPEGVQPGFDFIHGESVAAQIKAALQRKVQSLPPEIGAQLQSVLNSVVLSNAIKPTENAMTNNALSYADALTQIKQSINSKAFIDFYHSPKVTGNFEIGALSDADKQLLNTESSVVLMSKESLEHHKLKHPEIQIDDYKKLPEIIKSGEIYKTQNRRYVLLKANGKTYRAAMKITQDGKESYLLSLVAQSEKKATQEIRKKFEKIR